METPNPEIRNRFTTIFTGRRILPVLLLVIVLFAVFWQSTDHSFLAYDDNIYVTDNPHVRAGLTFRNILWAFTTMEASNWHPVTWLSHMLDSQIHGLNPRGHHLTNTLFHIANTLLLFCLLFSATRDYWQSMFVAALFALHPLHVESVAWIAERKDVLSAFFMFGTLILYTRYTRTPGLLLYLLALFFYVLGLMSKPMLVTLPFVMLLWDLWPTGRLRLEKQGKEETTHRGIPGSFPSTLMRLILEKVPFFFFSLLSSVVTYYAQAKGGSVAGIHSVPLTFRAVNALFSYTKYIVKMFCPHNLAVIYPLPPTLTLVQAAISVLILTGITFVVCRWARRNLFLLAGWFWYLGTLVPVIGFVQVGRQAMADRYTYIPLIGLFIMISWGVPALISRWPYRRSIIATVALLSLIVLTISTWKQLTLWKNDMTLFGHAVRVTDNNHIAHMNLGAALFQAGNIEAAIKHYYHALSFRPENDRLNYNLGLALGVKGNLNESIIYLTRAVTINPKFADAHYNLGIALVTTGRFEEGIRHFTEALQIDPGLTEARKALEAAIRLRSEKASQ